MCKKRKSGKIMKKKIKNTADMVDVCSKSKRGSHWSGGALVVSTVVFILSISGVVSQPR